MSVCEICVYMLLTLIYTFKHDLFVNRHDGPRKKSGPFLRVVFFVIVFFV